MRRKEIALVALHLNFIFFFVYVPQTLLSQTWTRLWETSCLYKLPPAHTLLLPPLPLPLPPHHLNLPPATTTYYTCLLYLPIVTPVFLPLSFAKTL